MVHFVPMRTGAKSPAKELAETFAREVRCLHGLPADIVSDRGSIFISTFWKELMEHLGVGLNLSTACKDSVRDKAQGSADNSQWRGG